MDNEGNQQLILKNILNALNAFVFVMEPGTCKILFANDVAKKTYKVDDHIMGEYCYKVFQKDKDARCEFCPYYKLEAHPETAVVWEQYEPLVGLHFRRTALLIDWPGGHKAHMEYGLDITEHVRQTEAVISREKMMSALNQTAVIFLSRGSRSFDEAMSEGIEILSGIAHFERMSIFRNYSMPDGRYASQVYRWYKLLGGPTEPLRSLANISLHERVSRWGKLLSAGEHINLPSRLIPEVEVLNIQNSMTMLLAPIIINDNFWGFSIFEKTFEEQPFSALETEILRSAGYMAVNFLIHSELEESLKFTAKRLQAALNESHSANRAKTEFLSRMSHEMRTPMNAVIGMSSIGMKTNVPTQKDHSFKKIKLAAEHLMSIINDILDFSKIETNQLELVNEDFIFNDMLQRVISMVQYYIDEKKLRFVVEISDDIPLCAVGDEQRLAQVILNLLSNAVKFTPEHGEIRLSVSLIDFSGDAYNIRFAVTDSGIGISPEQQERIFLAFEQAEGGNNRKYGGTGLGLPISKRIVRQMQGEIGVRSEPGKGSGFIFNVLLKRSKNETAAKTKNSEESLPGSYAGKSILIAEDVEINREIMTALLSDTGLDIRTANNGRAALDMLVSNPNGYDLVFMDVQMPEMDGIEATQRIRRSDVPALKTIPIIAMTANVYQEDIDNYLHVGMNGHISKPIDISAVHRKLNEYLNTETYNASVETAI